MIDTAKKLEELERELQTIRGLVLFERDNLPEKKLVSLRGMGKLLVSEEELERAEEEAKKSLFGRTENALRY